MIPDKPRGLSQEEAARRLEKHGRNEIYRRQQISLLGIARHELTEPMILLLLFIGAVYSIWGDLLDAVTIVVIITTLVLIEVVNEYRAKRAIAALAELTSPKARVVREGAIQEIETEAVVPGDLLVLTTGTKAAADARILHSVALQVDESALTGESFPLEKGRGDVLYAGTVVVSGEGDAEVQTTGVSTRIGQLAASAQTIKPPKTRLQLEMKALAGKLVYIAIGFSVLITLIGVVQGNDLRTMVLTGLSLSFATVPEELPIIITLVLGLGAYQLSKRNFLVKRLNAAETMGSSTVIVTDKTGTITEGRMQIAAFFPPDERRILALALSGVPPYSTSPIDLAIQEQAAARGLPVVRSPILRQRDFKEGRKTRAIIRAGGERDVLFVTGAPEEVLDLCANVPRGLQQVLERETARGRRVIAVACRPLLPEERDREWVALEQGLDLGGLIGFEDPPRPGVGETVAAVSRAGIRTVMVTGDHPNTAAAIARTVGILPEGARLQTGGDIDAMTDVELQAAVRNVAVFARATPDHKYRIVQALQRDGEVVAVTGDGINDALALRGADIGIAMGIRGTDVARDAAEVVLADDNYITITHGIFEGRKFTDNLRKGIRYYLSIKVALIAIFLLPALAGIPLPFAPIQIIVLELFMDLGASAGFVAEPAQEDIYRRPPRGRSNPILSRQMTREIALNGAVLFAAVMCVYFAAGWFTRSAAQVQTYAFAAWIFGHVTLAYITRSDGPSLLSRDAFSNRIINLWALSAIGFLFLATSIPLIARALGFPAGISSGYVLLGGLAAAAIVTMLEVKKGVGQKAG